LLPETKSAMRATLDGVQAAVAINSYLTFSIGAGAGLTLALTLMASLRERLELADVPAVARGAAIALIIASGLSLAFMGFAGLLTNP